MSSNRTIRRPTRPVQLKLARISAGITQQQLANMVGISENRLSKIETGRTLPSDEMVDRLSRILMELMDKPKDPSGFHPSQNLAPRLSLTGHSHLEGNHP